MAHIINQFRRKVARSGAARLPCRPDPKDHASAEQDSPPQSPRGPRCHLRAHCLQRRFRGARTGRSGARARTLRPVRALQWQRRLPGTGQGRRQAGAWSCARSSRCRPSPPPSPLPSARTCRAGRRPVALPRLSAPPARPLRGRRPAGMGFRTVDGCTPRIGACPAGCRRATFRSVANVSLGLGPRARLRRRGLVCIRRHLSRAGRRPGRRIPADHHRHRAAPERGAPRIDTQTGASTYTFSSQPSSPPLRRNVQLTRSCCRCPMPRRLLWPAAHPRRPRRPAVPPERRDPARWHQLLRQTLAAAHDRLAAADHRRACGRVRPAQPGIINLTTKGGGCSPAARPSTAAATSPPSRVSTTRGARAPTLFMTVQHLQNNLGIESRRPSNPCTTTPAVPRLRLLRAHHRRERPRHVILGTSDEIRDPQPARRVNCGRRGTGADRSYGQTTFLKRQPQPESAGDRRTSAALEPAAFRRRTHHADLAHLSLLEPGLLRPRRATASRCSTTSPSRPTSANVAFGCRAMPRTSQRQPHAARRRCYLQTDRLNSGTNSQVLLDRGSACRSTTYPWPSSTTATEHAADREPRPAGRMARGAGAHRQLRRALRPLRGFLQRQRAEPARRTSSGRRRPAPPCMPATRALLAAALRAGRLSTIRVFVEHVPLPRRSRRMTPVKPERSNYDDLGLEQVPEQGRHRRGSTCTTSRPSDLIDEGEFGRLSSSRPSTTATARRTAWSSPESTTSATSRAYGNLAMQRAHRQGHRIQPVQLLTGRPRLHCRHYAPRPRAASDRLRRGFLHLARDARQRRPAAWLRAAGATSPSPTAAASNGAHLPDHHQVNLGASHEVDRQGIAGLTARLDSSTCSTRSTRSATARASAWVRRSTGRARQSSPGSPELLTGAAGAAGNSGRARSELPRQPKVRQRRSASWPIRCPAAAATGAHARRPLEPGACAAEPEAVAPLHPCHP